jgi:dephospho-CoA kinase
VSEIPVSTSVTVVPYDSAWPARAAAELGSLREALGSLRDALGPPREALGPLVVHANHIGSTSIPQMAAKDILDLQLSVTNLDEAADLFDSPLAALGYQRRPYDHDHVPAGDDSDPSLWAKRYWNRRHHPAGDVNLHVRVAGAPNERLALLFRDWLRAHPAAVAGYSRFKLLLAASVPDLDLYTDIKDPVVDLVIAAAGEWAAGTGWQPHAGPDDGAPAS